MDVKVLGQDGKSFFPLMGTYGIGIARTVAAAIEQHHDEDGIVWPVSLAPYHVYFVVIGNSDEIKKKGEELYNRLKEKSIDVFYDDRKAGVGVKMKDADLLGLPVRLVLGERDFKAEGTLELKNRLTKEIEKVKEEDVFKKIHSVLDRQ